MMNWKSLTDLETLESASQASHNKPVLIFKHSTRCSVSATALDRLQREWKPENDDDLEIYLLDLIQYRPVSNEIAGHFSVPHQSPQVLIINKGDCVYDTSHFDIRYKNVMQALQSIK